MTAAEMILELQKLDPNVEISLVISDSKDSAWTDSVSGVSMDGKISGQASRSNPGSFAPWSINYDDLESEMNRR